MIYAGLPEVEREKALKDFAAGKTKVLCNVFILTEGYDLPRIDTVILNRATKSRIAWKQMIGRGLRPYEGKTVCKVIDKVIAAEVVYLSGTVTENYGTVTRNSGTVTYNYGTVTYNSGTVTRNYGTGKIEIDKTK